MQPPLSTNVTTTHRTSLEEPTYERLKGSSNNGYMEQIILQQRNIPQPHYFVYMYLGLKKTYNISPTLSWSIVYYTMSYCNKGCIYVQRKNLPSCLTPHPTTSSMNVPNLLQKSSPLTSTSCPITSRKTRSFFFDAPSHLH